MTSPPRSTHSRTAWPSPQETVARAGDQTISNMDHKAGRIESR